MQFNPVVVQRDYVCSICWADLTTYTEDHRTWLGCSRHKDAHKDAGFSRRSGTEAAKRRSKEELMEFKEGVKNFDWFDWDLDKPDYGDADNIIKSLGF